MVYLDTTNRQDIGCGFGYRLYFESNKMKIYVCDFDGISWGVRVLGEVRKSSKKLGIKGYGTTFLRLGGVGFLKSEIKDIWYWL